MERTTTLRLRCRGDLAGNVFCIASGCTDAAAIRQAAVALAHDSSVHMIQIEQFEGLLRGQPTDHTLLEAAAARLLDIDTADGAEAALALNLEAANLRLAHLEGADLGNANLQQADMRAARLDYANLYQANLQGADLRFAVLTGASLYEARLVGALLSYAGFKLADLRRAMLDASTRLVGVYLGSRKHEAPSVADVYWGDAGLAVVDWVRVQMLGDERMARQPRHPDRARKSAIVRLIEWQETVRAYRQLGRALRDQGINESADRFAYRAQMLQRQVLRRQRNWIRYSGSLLLDLVSGYGYRPLRSVVTYLLVVGLFGLAFWALGLTTGHTLTGNEAGVVSLTAFHGRGFFASAFSPGDPQAALAAIEAVIGLLVEITFIATFTQRFFAR
jgi:hypothetical protein